MEISTKIGSTNLFDDAFLMIICRFIHKVDLKKLSMDASFDFISLRRFEFQCKLIAYYNNECFKKGYSKENEPILK